MRNVRWRVPLLARRNEDVSDMPSDQVIPLNKKKHKMENKRRISNDKFSVCRALGPSDLGHQQMNSKIEFLELRGALN